MKDVKKLKQIKMHKLDLYRVTPQDLPKITQQKNTQHNRVFFFVSRSDINALRIVRAYEQNEDRTSCVLFRVSRVSIDQLSSK